MVNDMVRILSIIYGQNTRKYTKMHRVFSYQSNQQPCYFQKETHLINRHKRSTKSRLFRRHSDFFKNGGFFAIAHSAQCLLNGKSLNCYSKNERTQRLTFYPAHGPRRFHQRPSNSIGALLIFRQFLTPTNIDTVLSDQASKHVH